jgi:hypothetical protein
MPTTQSVTDEALSKLRHVIEANKAIDWRVFSFDDSSLPSMLQWLEHEGEQDELIPLLKAYQRLLRILSPSEDHRALPLLQAGLHSAIQIANIPQDQFAHQWAVLFPGEAALGEAVHRSAISRRSTLLLHHVNAIQSNEPHYRAARFR